MVRIISLIQIYLLSFTLYAQELNFRTLELADFQDTIPEKLIDDLKEKRVVLLGEQSHGDGATFEMKVMLIKQLHKRLGFNVIAFESGLYDCYKASMLSQKQPHTSISHYRDAVFPMWSETNSFSELIEYIESTRLSKNPLTIIGFDNQEGHLFEEHYFNDLKKLFLQSEISVREDTYEVVQEVFFGGGEVITSGVIDSLQFAKAIERTQEAFGRCRNTLHKKIMQQSFEGYLSAIYTDIRRTKGEKIYVQNPRDETMAENLVFLSELYPAKKIIGWGASYHFAYDLSNFQNTSISKQLIADFEAKKPQVHEKFNLDSALYNALPMGQIVKQKLSQEVYSIAFTSFDGSFKDIGDQVTYDLPKPPAQSLEYYLNQEKHDYVFVKFDSSQESMFYSSILGNIPLMVPWQKAFDGLIFIRNAYPPKQENFKNEAPHKETSRNDRSISGTIADQNGSPIPYAHIIIKGTSTGTVSNDMGEFTFKFASSYNQDTIKVTSLGFKERLLGINEIENDYPLSLTLEKHTSNLGEFVVYAEKLDPKKIIQKARNRIHANYYQEPLNQEFFYRVNEKRNDTTHFNEEAMVLTYLENGFQPTSKPYGSIYGEVLQYRNTTKNPNKYKWEGVGSLWLVFTHDLILDKNNPLHKTSAYDFTISNIVTNPSGDRVYEISFECKRPSSYTTGFGYPAPKKSHGKIYINADDYAVLRYEHCIHRKDYSSSKKKFEVKNHSHQLIQTYTAHKGRYFLNYSKQIESFEVYYPEKGTSFSQTNNYDLLMTKMKTEEPTIIRKPIEKIKQGSMPIIDHDFWSNHNFSISDKLSSTKCDSLGTK